MKLTLCLSVSIVAMSVKALVLFLVLCPSFLKLHGTYSFIA